MQDSGRRFAGNTGDFDAKFLILATWFDVVGWGVTAVVGCMIVADGSAVAKDKQACGHEKAVGCSFREEVGVTASPAANLIKIDQPCQVNREILRTYLFPKGPIELDEHRPCPPHFC